MCYHFHFVNGMPLGVYVMLDFTSGVIHDYIVEFQALTDIGLQIPTLWKQSSAKISPFLP